ncbi:MAG: SH3 domain-containing protein [Eubacteriales bacterium]|nr:SH3 domain-containing protein [Eubacteriales bacterium]
MGRQKRIAAALALCLCLMLTGTALAESYGVIYNTDTLNLRSQGSSDSQWLGTYNRGTWLQIVGSQNDFYQVYTPDGKTGYMSKNYIDTTGDSYQTRRIAMVTNQNGGAFLNFRLQPNYTSQVLGIFYYGVPLLVLSESNGWYCVQMNGQTGYVRSEYVTVSDTVGSGTVATIKTPNNTSMNMRQGPGNNYGVVRQFSGDRYVMVLAQGTNWWRVAIDGYTGFMNSSFLTLGLNAAKDIAAQNGGGASGGSYGVVSNPRSTQALNLRVQPTTSAAVLEKLYNGAKLWVDEQGAEWSAVTVQQSGISGYVMTQYLKLYNLPTTPTRVVYHPNGTYVNLRSTPDLTYGTVKTRVPTGRSVTILTPGAEWCKVKYNGYSGYMLTYFLQ